MDIRSAVQRHGDLLIAVLLALLLTTEIALWDTADHPKAVPAALLATLPLVLRRKSPLVSFLLVSAGTFGVLFFARGIDNESMGFIVVFFVSLYSLGRHTRGPEVWIGAAVVAAYTVTFMLGDPGSDVGDLGDLGFAIGFVGGPWAAGLAIKLRRDREQLLSAQNAQLQQDQEEQARAAVAAERARIARELHDVVSHAISVTVLQARGGRRMIGVDESEVRRSLDAIEHTNTQALGDMRRLLSLLRGTEDDHHGGEGESTSAPQPSLARLSSLVEHLRASGLPVELEVRGERDDVPPGVDLSAYRIIQEALTNVIKHAGPSATARVEVVCGAEQLDIRVADTGMVNVNGNGRGHGLIGIRERVAVVGGRVEAGPDEAGGFVVRARLPYAVET